MNLEHFDAHPEEVIWKDLNNWYFNLPGGYNRESAEELDWMDLTKRETASSNLEFYSNKRKSQTNREFFAEIDDSLVKLGFSLENIASKNQEINKLARTIIKNEKEKILILQETLPVYNHMRQKGYNHYELIA